MMARYCRTFGADDWTRVVYAAEKLRSHFARVYDDRFHKSAKTLYVKKTIKKKEGYIMKHIKLVTAITIVFLFCSSIASAEVVYDVELISDPNFDTYNSVMSNLILNYWDDDGYFDGKETGLWKGDYMGDSHFRAIDNLSALAFDSRLLSGSTAEDRLDTRHDLLQKVNLTVEYTTYIQNKLKTILGQYQGQIGLTLALSQLSPGELYVALSGGIGYSSAFVMASKPEYALYAPANYPYLLAKPRFGADARDFADLILRLKFIDVIKGEDAKTLLDLLTKASNFPESKAMANCAYAMLRLAKNDDLQIARALDIEKSKIFVNGMAGTRLSETVRAYLLMAELKGDPEAMDKAIEIGDLIEKEVYSENEDYPGFDPYLSTYLRQIDALLALYEVRPEQKYIDLVDDRFEAINTYLLIDDPRNPGFKTVAHHKGFADIVKAGNWPPNPMPENYQPFLTEAYPACTGCVHVFCHMIHLYDALKKRDMD